MCSKQDQPDQESKPHQFLLMWCTEGLEYVGDITQDQKNAVWASLQNREYCSTIPNIMHLELRARYNSQRFYEIYVVEATAGITSQHFRDLFEQNPQGAADLIRERGTRLFGSPMGQQRTLIR